MDSKWWDQQEHVFVIGDTTASYLVSLPEYNLAPWINDLSRRTKPSNVSGRPDDVPSGDVNSFEPGDSWI